MRLHQFLHNPEEQAQNEETVGADIAEPDVKIGGKPEKNMVTKKKKPKRK